MIWNNSTNLLIKIRFSLYTVGNMGEACFRVSASVSPACMNNCSAATFCGILNEHLAGQNKFLSNSIELILNREAVSRSAVQEFPNIL
jgi:hypothetical protein